MKDQALRIGWARADITPQETVNIHGQFHVRISQGVRDPLTATVLVLENADHSAQAVMVSLDLVAVGDYLRDQVREKAAARCEGLQPEAMMFNATHTHTGPGQYYGEVGRLWYPPLPADAAMDYKATSDFIVERVVDAVVRAWENRAPGAFAYGSAPAVIGTNRRVCYRDGNHKMYGKTDVPEFTHIEGDCDHNALFLFTYDAAEKLTGMIVNVACPSQTFEQGMEISADYWHETRQAVAEQFGDDVFVLPQCSAAGDQSPHFQVNPAMQRRMLEQRYGDTDVISAWRLEIARRITRAAEDALDVARGDIQHQAVLAHHAEVVDLPRWMLTEAHLELAQKGLDQWQERLDALPVDPTDRDYSCAYAKVHYHRRVFERYELQQRQPTLATEVHAVRLGPVVFATNRFELFMDYGQRIKTRSCAIQTFIVQLAGEGTYLPAARACHGDYSATPMDGPVGPQGGDVLVERTLSMLDGLFADDEQFNPFGARF